MPWRWAWLLGLALMAPVGLPAGGGDPSRPGLRRRNAGEPLLASGPRRLQSSPDLQAPVLAVVESGQPLQVLDIWRDDAGRRWRRVRGGRHRGWLVG